MSFWDKRHGEIGRHVHLPSQILNETTGDPNAGGSLTVDNRSDPPAAVTRLVAPGARITDGSATLGTIAVKSILSRSVAQGDQTLPGGDQFTTLAMESMHDPGGYYSANLPQSGVPGFLVPEGQGGLHRISLSARIQTGTSTDPGNHRIFAAISFLGVTAGIPADLRDALPIENDDIIGDDQIFLAPSYVGQLDEGEEVYFYAKSGMGVNGDVNPGTYAIIERISTV